MPLFASPRGAATIAETRLVAVPASLTSPGRVGDQARDSDYLYIYIGNGFTHAWKRVSLATYTP